MWGQPHVSALHLPLNPIEGMIPVLCLEWAFSYFDYVLKP